jgi:cob(I)alamin adenosyltransferase
MRSWRRAAPGAVDANALGAGDGTVLAELTLRIQRELFVVGAELATTPDARDRQQDGVTRVSRAMVDALGDVLASMEATIELPREFIVPGETRLSAALEVARTVARRAERRTVTLAAADAVVAAGNILAYLNRLADLLWVLARVAEQLESQTTTVARPDRPGGPRTTSTQPNRGATE